MQSGNALTDEFQNRWLSVTGHEKNDVVELEFAEDVGIAISVDVIAIFNRFISTIDEGTILGFQVFTLLLNNFSNDCEKGFRQQNLQAI